MGEGATRGNDSMSIRIGRRAFGLGLAASTLSVLAPASAQAQSAGLIERRESQYNTVYVARRENGEIIMLFGVNRDLFTESVYDPAAPQTLPVTYTRYMTAGLAYVANARSILEIGLGGGRTAYYLHRNLPDVRITCVELDPQVIDLAKRHFGIAEDARFRIPNRDGRIWLNQNAERHDLILVDAYRGTFVPFHLLTREFFMLVKRRLNPGGALVQNIEPSTMLYPAALATIGAVFDNIDTYQAGGNIVAIAYDGPAKSDAALAARAEALQRARSFPHALPALVRDRRRAAARDGQILTDDFAPVEALRAIELHNQRQ